MTQSTVPDVTLRMTTADDLTTVTRWERRPENAAFVEVWPRARHLAALTDPAIRHFMVECDDRAVGYTILAGLGDAAPVVELRRIVVAEKGRGIGQSAVATVVRHAFDAFAAREVWLDFVEHNARAAHVYSKCGFRVDPEAELWAEIDGERRRLVKMTRSQGEEA